MISNYFFGPFVEDNKVTFTHRTKALDSYIVFYNKKTKEEVERICLNHDENLGDIREITLPIKYANYAYQFIDDEVIVPDLYAKAFLNCFEYGESRTLSDYMAIVPESKYDWGEMKESKNDCMYLCHVRGFTKDTSSKVKNKGTFLGLAQKAEYLYELGVGTVELQPAYEFNENFKDYRPTKEIISLLAKDVDKKNYWGYTEGFYYSPKLGYSDSNPVREFKEMVNKLHSFGIKVIMQFFFPRKTLAIDIVNVLLFWKREYHINGFRLLGDDINIGEIADNPLISDVEIYFDSFDGCEKSVKRIKYNDDCLVNLRKFLKADDCSIEGATYSISKDFEYGCRVNYLSNFNHFTIRDSVSYNNRNNYANGEDNCDGRVDNFSWNCGEEGPTKKKKIQQLRSSQIKNALILLFLSRGIPLLTMGDEFGRSTCGNNNPYCIDGRDNYVDWKLAAKNTETIELVKKLNRIRQENKVFAQNVGVDQLNRLKYPPVSFHSANAWESAVNPASLHGGFLFADEAHDSYVYLAINMHWENKDLCLPKISKSVKWKVIIQQNEESNTDYSDCKIQLPPRSVIVFKGENVK